MWENFLAFKDTVFGGLFLSILVYLIVYVIGTNVSCKIIDIVSKRVDPTALHWKLLKQVIKVVFVVIFVLGVTESVPNMNNVGTTLVACSSVIVAALGLASQDALGNAIDGVFISFFKPFSVGDRVRLAGRGITGTVEGINLRYTSIRTVENNLLLIPNSIMNDEVIENSNIGSTNIKAFLDVDITYQSNLQMAKDVMIKLALEHPLFLDARTDEEKENNVPPVNIMVRSLTSNGVSLRASVWSDNINDSFQLCSDLRENLLIEFKRLGIEIPYQTIEIINKGC